MLSATVHDVLYYMSPIYCQDIVNSTVTFSFGKYYAIFLYALLLLQVSNQLNRLYLKFRKRNPGYDGKVSVYGHSLGSVLLYDILCHQENLSSPFPMDWMYKEQEDTIEESSHALNNQPSNGDSSTDLKGKSSTETNETEDKVGSADEDKMGVQSAHLEHQEAPAEDFSSLVGTVVSDTAAAMDFEQTAKEDTDQLVQSSSDTMSSDMAGFNELPHERWCPGWYTGESG
ncbi:hypothetical protein Patl1_10713 [Pistacia atlantica]|uniref:Uncharacterized protein n=1 Tax=Pistacia atlantica TaxID=434234 RepID=A0ACC1A1S9_9ROSI|nr:hypothetical protein Patl1_10713 [Pistacia atlantica]